MAALTDYSMGDLIGASEREKNHWAKLQAILEAAVAAESKLAAADRRLKELADLDRRIFEKEQAFAGVDRRLVEKEVQIQRRLSEMEAGIKTQEIETERLKQELAGAAHEANRATQNAREQGKAEVERLRTQDATKLRQIVKEHEERIQELAEQEADFLQRVERAKKLRDELARI